LSGLGFLLVVFGIVGCWAFWHHSVAGSPVLGMRLVFVVMLLVIRSWGSAVELGVVGPSVFGIAVLRGLLVGLAVGGEGWV